MRATSLLRRAFPAEGEGIHLPEAINRLRYQVGLVGLVQGPKLEK
jgi:hypothetical protein